MGPKTTKMLVQMPPRPERPNRQGAEQSTEFEEALRRDLATAPVVPYDHMVGGWSKRAIDLLLVMATAPLWLLLLGAAILQTRLRTKARVLVSDQRVGYGGRTFAAYRLELERPKAEVTHLHAPESPPANDTGEKVVRTTPWTRFVILLPQLLNVLKGEMSLVGPKPLTHDELEPLKIGKRYYLSARPGLMGVSSLVDASPEDGAQYKAYALSQSPLIDALLMWDAVKTLRANAALWRPEGHAKLQARVRSEVLARRRRGDASPL